jgi:predicted GH43/DUF377 family glycosyl hydrolase
MDMDPDLPGYYRTLLDVQPGFWLRADATRRLPAVLDHLIKPERLAKVTEEISRLSPKILEARGRLLEPCFEGICDLEDYLLHLFNRFFGEGSPFNGCSQNLKVAAASAIVQAFPYEGLACFNPTIVSYPPDGSENQKVTLAVRSYGEFHRSSISFRTGIIDTKRNLVLDEPDRTPTGLTRTVLPKVEGRRFNFPEDANLNNLVIYAPFMVENSETWEDIRFTPFMDEGEYEGCFLGTFTSFNFMKQKMQAGVLITKDFRSFEYHLLKGAGVEDKDFAYFPRSINGRYGLLSRNDGRDLYYMTSDNPFSWTKKKRIATCRPDSFDAHKLGVCAPPIETKEGWLVIYHGVADPGQIYSLSAMLLDLEDPCKVIARLPYTLHCPLADEREGMLSNINYTCGAVLHEPTQTLIIPFACNDTFIKVGRIGLDELTARLIDDGK